MTKRNRHGLTAKNLWDIGRVFFTHEGFLVRNRVDFQGDMVISPGCERKTAIFLGDFFHESEVES